MFDKAKWYIGIGIIWGYITAPILFEPYTRELVYNILGSGMTYLLPFLPISWVSIFTGPIGFLLSGPMGGLWGFGVYKLVSRISNSKKGESQKNDKAN